MKWHSLKTLEWLVDGVMKLLVEVVSEIAGTIICSATSGLF
jgi:hypothetical protein